MELIPVFILLVLGAASPAFTQDLIGYDCSNPDAKTSVVDLLNVEPCVRPKSSISERSGNFQVVQTQIYRPVHIYICLIKITRIIFHCGHASHISAVSEGFATRLLTLGRSKCQTLHETRILTYGQYTIDDIKANGTTMRTILLAGSLDSSGNCEQGTYSDEYGTWSKVVVQGTITIKIEDYTATLLTAEDKLIMPRSGLSCPAKDEYCMDSQQGEIMWTYRDSALCKQTDVDVLYEGKGTVAETPDNPPILIVSEHSNTFAIKLHTQTYLCGRTVFRTEHGRIYVSEAVSNTYQFAKGADKYNKNIDLTSHISSKFLYIAQNIHQNLVSLITDLTFKDCETRKLTMENRLALATLAPDHVGMLTEGPGYYGRVLGEVLYIVQCVPVSVTLRYVKKCFQEIPVVYNNESTFLSPVTHLIVPVGREIPCQAVMHPKFMLGPKWYVRNPDLVETPPPRKLDPNNDIFFEYTPLIDISVGGLYSQEQLRSLQAEMMLPSVREAVSTNFVRHVQHMGASTFDTQSLWTDSDLTSISATVAGKISWFFQIFGSYASTLIGVYLAWKLTVYLIGVITNCCVLKKSGYSFKYFILGLIDSLTSLVTTHKYLWKKPTNVEEGIKLEVAENKESTDVANCVATAPDKYHLYPYLKGADRYPTRAPSGFFKPTVDGLI